MKRFIWVVFIALILLNGCTPSEAQNENNDTVNFTDSLGREVSVCKSPQRVAALLGSFADVWTLAGGTLCAAAEDAWEDFGLESEETVNIGGAHSPVLELLLSSDPQFVIASASTASNVEMRETLERLGIIVAYFDVDCFDDYLKMLDICTDITGRKDLYLTNGLNLKDQIEKVKTEYKNGNIEEEHKKVLLLRASSGFVKVKDSEGTILGEMLLDIGCINVADTNRSLLESLSVEEIINTEPYHIFVVTMGSDTQAALESVENLFNENPAWSTLDAVKNGRVYVMDKSLFNLKPNSRWAEAYQKLYETLTRE